MSSDIRPVSLDEGVGFFSDEQLPKKISQGYCEERVDSGYKYYFTGENWQWPTSEISLMPFHIIDAFSPNLNKELDINHLRQLSLATSLYDILANCRFVALLGTSLGVVEQYQQALVDWLKFVGYSPQLFYEKLLPHDLPVGTYKACSGKYEGCYCLAGPKGPIILIGSDKRHTYAFHDLVFAKIAKPTFYIASKHHKKHFELLGFGSKHLIIGNVLDFNGKKLKSRDGELPTAMEAMQCVIDRLKEASDPRRLAWNVLVWNFLNCPRDKPVFFDPDLWTKSNNPGIKISKVYSELWTVLNKISNPRSEVEKPLAKYITDTDLQLLGLSEYYWHWRGLVVSSLDPLPLTNFTSELANLISVAFHEESLEGGRGAFKFAMYYAGHTLQHCMESLGMFLLEKI